jgi:protein TonB
MGLLTRGVAAVAVAGLVNAGMLGLLAWLNAQDLPERTRPPASVTLARPAASTEPREPEPKPEPTAKQSETTNAPSVPEPSVDPAEPGAIEPAGVALDVPTASISPVAISPAGVDRGEPGRSGEERQSAEPARGSELDGGLRPLKQVQPEYPPRLRREGREGWVRVRLTIDREGRVMDARVLESQGGGAFERAVMDVIDQWRFDPPRRNGQPVRARAAKTFRFQLGN